MKNFSASEGRVAIRPLADRDREDLHRWLNDPAVLAYYEGRDNPQSYADIDTHFLAMQGDPVQGCIIVIDGRSAGFLQVYPLSQGELSAYHLPAGERTFGIDLFIGETALWDQGLGTAVMMLATRTLVRDYQADAVTVDPRVDNPRAVRVYEKCGYRIHRRLEAAEKHEGIDCDCWLMVYRPA